MAAASSSVVSDPGFLRLLLSRRSVIVALVVFLIIAGLCIFAAYLVVGALVLIAQPFKPKKRDLFGR